MENFIQMLMGGAAPNPSEIPAKRTYTAAQERQARSAGYPSAEAMVLRAQARPASARVAASPKPLPGSNNILSFIYDQIMNARH